MSLTSMPALIFVDYISGMWPIPQQLIHAIAMQTAVNIFPVLSDAVAQGRAETVAKIQTIEERNLYVTRSELQAFQGRINNYQKEINRVVSQSRAWLFSTSGRSFIGL